MPAGNAAKASWSGRNGEQAGAERFDGAGSLHRGDERGVIRGIDGVLDDDVLVSSIGAPHRVGRIGDTGNGRDGEHGGDLRRPRRAIFIE